MPRILKARKTRQNGLARTLDVKPQIVTKWLKGPDKPSAERLFQIADALDVSLDKLIGRVPPGLGALQELNKLDISAAISSLLPDEPIVTAATQKAKEQERTAAKKKSKRVKESKAKKKRS